jgi:hypothetical protein
MHWSDLNHEAPLLAARATARLLVCSIVTSRDGAEGELKLRGTAVTATDDSLIDGYAAEVGERLGWRPEPAAGPLIGYARLDPCRRPLGMSWSEPVRSERRSAAGSSTADIPSCSSLADRT